MIFGDRLLRVVFQYGARIMGSGDIVNVTLTGGAPWGFRLFGGEGFPIEVAKVTTFLQVTSIFSQQYVLIVNLWFFVMIFFSFLHFHKRHPKGTHVPLLWIANFCVIAMCLLSYNITSLFPTCFEELKQGCLMYELENSSDVILVQMGDFLTWSHYRHIMGIAVSRIFIEQLHFRRFIA